MKPQKALLLPAILLPLVLPSAGAAIIAGVSDATGAYSLRKVVDAYAGAAINVRRDSDGMTMDIGFDGSGNLDTAALLTFVGSGNGTVTSWYDQASGGAVAASVAANEPTIVSSGSLVTASNGLAAVRFDGTNDSLHRAMAIDFSTTTVLSVSTFSGATANNLLDERVWGMANSGSTRFAFGGNSNQYAIGANHAGSTNVYNSGLNYTTGVAFQATVTLNAPDTGATDAYNLFINGNSELSNSTRDLNNNANTFLIGAQTTTSGERILNGNVQEILVFSTVLSGGDQSTLESNQFAFYAIPEPSALMLSALAIPALLLRRRK